MKPELFLKEKPAGLRKFDINLDRELVAASERTLLDALIASWRGLLPPEVSEGCQVSLSHELMVLLSITKNTRMTLVKYIAELSFQGGAAPLKVDMGLRQVAGVTRGPPQVDCPIVGLRGKGWRRLVEDRRGAPRTMITKRVPFQPRLS